MLSYGLSFGQTHKLDSVKIEFEGFFTETIIDVPCDAFDYSFKETKKVKIIHDKTQLSLFNTQLKNLQHITNKPLDVRGKITYHYRNSNRKYCFDKFGKFYRNGQVFYNKKLLIAISDILYSNHPDYLNTLKFHE